MLTVHGNICSRSFLSKLSRGLHLLKGVVGGTGCDTDQFCLRVGYEGYAFICAHRNGYVKDFPIRRTRRCMQRATRNIMFQLDFLRAAFIGKHQYGNLCYPFIVYTTGIRRTEVGNPDGKCHFGRFTFAGHGRDRKDGVVLPARKHEWQE